LEGKKSLAEKTSELEIALASSGEGSKPDSPEAYLENLVQEKDTNGMLHFSQLVQAKYMQLMSQNYLEQLSKGVAVQGGMPGMVGSFPQPGVGMAANPIMNAPMQMP